VNIRDALVLALALTLLAPSVGAAPPIEGPREADTGRIEGRVRSAGRRTPLVDAKLLIVAAPEHVQPGRPARERLDPAAVDWVREAQTDEQGEFVIDDLPIGKVRVVILAAGHRRTEVWAEVTSDDDDEAPLQLFVELDDPSGFRTEVVSERHVEDAVPEHRVDAKQALMYPGSGADPIRAALNLPGVARSPGGLGMVAIRGANPQLTGVYLDGHPIPRGFHVLPIASVVTPALVESVELTPGNYDAAFGGHAAGLLHIRSRPGPLAGAEDRAIHGEAHLDLFDVGGTVAGPVGPGAITFGFRRAHVGNVIETADKILPEDLGILVPNYWDYLGRFDMPLAKGQVLTVRMLGAGDRLRDVPQFEASDPYAYIGQSFDFAAAFHRIDLGYSIERGRLRLEVSPALRLDSSTLDFSAQQNFTRHAWVGSLRASLSYRLARRATLVTGVDVVDEHWRRTEIEPLSLVDPTAPKTVENRGRDLALGTWLGVALRFDPKPGPLIVRAQVRLNLFGEGHEVRAMPDPRVDLRFRVHPRVEWLAAFGQYSSPFVTRREDSASVADPLSLLPNGATLDVPPWLIRYFDPGIDGEVDRGTLLIMRTLQASTGIRIELPWQLGLRATGFWRHSGEQNRVRFDDRLSRWSGVRLVRERGYGFELLLERALARGIHGWLGYTLLRAQQFYADRVGAIATWWPSPFEQRHNLIALVSFGLPRNFRFGVRFRVVSGNPDAPIVGSEIHQGMFGTEIRPIRQSLGSDYRPLFHQLDLRVDKIWPGRRASTSVYLDIQNVYNNRYPELWIYTTDYLERSDRIGLPIFPSLGLRVDY
jgi:hypothetical protein